MMSKRFLCSAFAAILIVSGAGLASELGQNDFRISDMGNNGDTAVPANYPSVAYNSTNNEFLVAWVSNDGTAEYEVYVQRIHGGTGLEVGANDVRISDMGPDGNANYRATWTAVAYNATDNEYLVVWRGDDNTGALIDNEFEIYGQRLNALTGAEVGTGDFRISSMGPDGDTTYVADIPALAWNSTNNEYLVVWRGNDDSAPGETEIWGRRLASTGTGIGGDLRISDAGAPGDIARSALNPRVAYNSTNNEYLVVWQADDLATDNEVEVFGQRLNAATGLEVGTNDFRITEMGTDTDTAYRGQTPDVAHNPLANEYLVVFAGSDPALGSTESEIWAQRLAADGSDIGATDFRISVTGPDGNAAHAAIDPFVSFSVARNEYLVVWYGDKFSDNDTDVFGQRISASGAEIGVDDFRLSDMGPDGDTAYRGGDAKVAHGANGLALIVFTGDDDILPLVEGEQEIFGQFYRFTAAEPEDDFNGDGNNDLFWRQPSTGKNVHWAMDGTTRLSYTSLLDVPGSAWTLAGTGHFNPGTDTHPDLLWRNSSTGQNVAWGMNGTTRISYASLLTVPNPWEVGGVDDFDGDGDADIVWRNPSNGQNVLWTMDGTTRSSYASMLSVVGPEWKIGGVGDFDGDGKPDLVWRNYTTGQNVIWFMDGATRTSYASTLSTPTPAWRLQGVSDYDLDGKADLVWRNVTTGQNVIWFMNGANRSTYGATLSVTDFSWEIQSPR